MAEAKVERGFAKPADTLLAHIAKVSGGYIGGGPPVPIPNTEVKPSRADGTARPACGRVGRCRNFSPRRPAAPPSRGASPFQPTKRFTQRAPRKGRARRIFFLKSDSASSAFSPPRP